MNDAGHWLVWLPSVLLAVAALWAVRRTCTGPVAARGWRKALRVVLNLLVAGLLGALLLATPADPPAPHTWTVLTAGVTAEQRAQLRAAAAPDAPRAVRLPGAPDDPLADPEPDLGSALRRAGPLSGLRVIGDGLAAHDRAALTASALPMRFEAAPPRAGIVTLQWPRSVLAGRRFLVEGRWQAGPDTAGKDGIEVELLSPGGQRVDRQPVASDGRFRLQGEAPIAGPLRWQVRVHRLATTAAPAAALETADVEVVVQAPRPLNVQVLAGAADPDLKYLRRWAVDAGLVLRSRVMLTSGIAVQGAQPPLALDAAGLDALDLLIVDERSWVALPAATRSSILAAVRRGLGLLLRLRALPAPAVGVEWAGLGVRWQADTTLPLTVSLRTRLALPDTAPLFGRLRLQVTAPLAQSLLEDDSGQPLGLAWPHGRGRLGTWWWLDSFKLRLGGQPGAHAEVWSRAVEQLARPQAEVAPEWLHPPRVGERAVVCGLDPALQWQIAAVGSAQPAVPLLPVAAAQSSRRCAAWWPVAAGWHRLETLATVAGAVPGSWPVAVRGAGSLPALEAAERQAATRALVTPLTANPPERGPVVPVKLWCWALLLVLLSALWWLERAPPSPTSADRGFRA